MEHLAESAFLQFSLQNTLDHELQEFAAQKILKWEIPI